MILFYNYRSLVHQFILVYSVKYRLDSVFFQVAIHLSQYHSLESLTFPSLICSATFIICYICMCIWASFWFIYFSPLVFMLFMFQYHTVLITQTSQYLLICGRATFPPHLFFFWVLLDSLVYFLYKLQIQLLQLWKKLLVLLLGRIDICMMSSDLIQDHVTSFYLFKSTFFWSFKSAFYKAFYYR